MVHMTSYRQGSKEDRHSLGYCPDYPKRCIVQERRTTRSAFRPHNVNGFPKTDSDDCVEYVRVVNLKQRASCSTRVCLFTLTMLRSKRVPRFPFPLTSWFDESRIGELRLILSTMFLCPFLCLGVSASYSSSPAQEVYQDRVSLHKVTPGLTPSLHPQASLSARKSSVM